MEGLYDQGALLRSGQALVPDLLGQDLQRQQVDNQRLASQADLMRAQQTGLAARNTMQRQQDYGAAVQAYEAHPTIAGLHALFQYPEFSEATKRLSDLQDEQQTRTLFQDSSEIYSALRNGHPEIAAGRVRRHMDADRSAGREVDPNDQVLLDAIDSRDPTQLAQAMEIARRHAAILAGPERYASVYGTDDPHPVAVAPGQGLYDPVTGSFRVSPVEQPVTTSNGGVRGVGPPAGTPLLGGGVAPPAQPEPLAPAPVQPPTPASVAPQTAYNPARHAREGIGGLSPNGFSIGQGYAANARGTDGKGTHVGLDLRAPERTPFRIGVPIRVLGSHTQTVVRNGRNGGNIADVVYPDGTQWRAMHLPNLPAAGNYPAGSDVLRSGRSGIRNSGAHIHWQPANAAARAIYAQGPRATAQYLATGSRQSASSGPVRVRTIQEARRLPAGTHFIGPDGREWTR